MLSFVSICPHPPIIIPTIGSPSDLKLVSKTIEGMTNLAKIFAEAKPQTVLVISPHGPVDFNQFSVVNSPVLAGHFYNFGDFQTELIFKNDQKLIGEIEKEAQKESIPLRSIKIKELDHGSLVPLYYLSQGLPNIKVVPLAYSYLDLEAHFKFGKILQKAISGGQSSGNYGIITSGDLSHRLTPDAPAGYSPRGKEFDKLLIDLLEKKGAEEILKIDPSLVEEAGECGYRSIIILLGALDGLNYKSEILSYEGPFGVGYLVANFKIPPKQNPEQKQALYGGRQIRYGARKMNPYVSLAKLAVETYVSEDKIISSSNDLPAAPSGEPRLWREEFLKRKAGTFVTIEKAGSLRGCIGTYLPTKENIAQEIIQNAIAAATEDYRFGSIQKEELPYLSYTVYILSEPELVKDISGLNPKKYGIIVKTAPIISSQKTDVIFNGHFSTKTGLLLPDLEGVDTVEKQISIACQKGGVDPQKERIIIYRFTTEKYDQ